jgi:ATP-binding cassette subfamily B protein/subfamily B ATP-binding cassette protein MsbA
MTSKNSSSRRRFIAYRESLKQNSQADNGKPAPGTASSADKPRSGTTRSAWRLIWQFWRLLESNKAAVIWALATLTIATLLKLIPPAATKITIDYVLTDRPLPAHLAAYLPATRSQLLVAVTLGVVVISLVSSVIHLWGRWYATRATKRMQAGVRRRVFEHAVRLPLHRVYQLKSGGVASLLRDDAGDIAELIFSAIYNPWRAILQLIGSLLILAWVDWRLLLGSLVLIPLILLTHRTWISRIRPMHRRIREQRQEIDAHATEAFGGMRVVRAFRREPSESARFTRNNHLMSRQELLAWWWMRAIEAVWDAIVPVASAALLLYGGFRVLSGQLSLGDVMMFLFYLTMLLGPLETLVNSATQLQGSLAGLDRVLDVLDEPREMQSSTPLEALNPDTIQGNIELRNVSFRYPGTDELVLENINLNVPAGHTIALVGRSGAGKTTLCNLIARFFDPTAGQILLDGVDLRAIDVRSYRRLLGIVEQDVFLFDGTIAENIGYAVRHATRAQIEHAARMANAHEFIVAFEKGYDTVIGERGVRLSGGERQRLAIARAILAQPRIRILDEATSNLDTESERKIQESLRRLMHGGTTFVIAHRLSTITHADQIVVLERGRIIEIGTHTRLMAASGKYRHMVSMQIGAWGTVENVEALRG